jgi:hypothetical protein
MTLPMSESTKNGVDLQRYSDAERRIIRFVQEARGGVELTQQEINLKAMVEAEGRPIERRGQLAQRPPPVGVVLQPTEHVECPSVRARDDWRTAS